MILVNGSPDACVSPADRGLAYGDGVFRTLLINNGQVVAWPEQYDRLAADAASLGIPMPEASLLAGELDQVCQGVVDGVGKIVLSRGEGPRGYAPPAACVPTRIVSSGKLPAWPEQWRINGVNVRLCELRLAHQPRLAGIKHLNRLEQVLARAEWQDSDIAEGILLDQEGWLVGGTMSNVVLWRAGALQTPVLDRCGVAGLTRSRLQRLAGQHGVTWQELRLRPQDLLQAEEVMLCNSVFGVWQVRRLADRSWQPGQMTKQLRDWLEKA